MANDNKLWIIGLVLVAMLAINLGWIELPTLSDNMLQSILTLEQKYFYQYAGNLHCQYDNWVCDANRQPNPPINAGVIEINNYKVVTEKKDFGQTYGEPYCSDNTCGGELDFVDENGCQHWKHVHEDVYQCIRNDYWTTGGAHYGDGCFCLDLKENGQVVGQLDRGDLCEKLFYYNKPHTVCTGKWYNYPTGCHGSYLTDKFWELYQEAGVDTCGGQTRDMISHTEECWYRYNIYKDGELIKNSEYDTDRKVEQFEDITMVFANEKKWQNNIKECRYIQNQFIFKIPDDSLNFEIETPSQVVFEGSNINVKVVVKNSWIHDIKGELKVEFGVPTVIGLAERTEIEIVDIPVGETVFEYNIPTTQITDKLFVKPEVTLLLEGNKFSGVNGLCYGHEDRYIGNLAQCEYVKVGKITDDEHIIHISPKPLYLDKPDEGCQSLQGYEDSLIDEDICVRDDITQLSCMQTGCPSIEIDGEQVDFICTTSGFCAQTIYKRGCETDIDCAGLDAKCLESSSGEKFCVHERIVDNIIYVPDPFPVTKTCADFNFCQEGYVCIDKEIDGELVAYCQQEDIPCPTDIRTCDDGTILYRDINNYCQFPDCPIEPPSEPSPEESNKIIYILGFLGFILFFFR